MNGKTHENRNMDEFRYKNHKTSQRQKDIKSNQIEYQMYIIIQMYINSFTQSLTLTYQKLENENSIGIIRFDFHS